MKAVTKLFFDLAPSGHRRGYLEYYAGLAGRGADDIIFGRSLDHFRKLVAADKVLLSSADHYLPFALALGAARRILGKHTGALYIAAELRTFEGGLVSGLKGFAMRLARLLCVIDAVSITPFQRVPSLGKLCRGWVYDAQFCAGNRGGNDETDSGEKELLEWAVRQDKLVILLGNLDPKRGLLDMLEASARAPEFSFLAAGRLNSGAEKLLSKPFPTNFRLAAGSLSTAAFDRLVFLASIVWCYFPASYDQNSGLFCNAVRSGRDVLLRSGSLLNWLADRSLEEVDSPKPSWLHDDALLFCAGAKRVPFLRDCEARNLSWIRGTMGDTALATDGDQGVSNRGQMRY